VFIVPVCPGCLGKADMILAMSFLPARPDTGGDRMSSTIELKSIGLKATLPRLKILEIFQQGRNRHMSAEDVYRELLAENQDIGLATVYRVLTQFEQAGLLKRSNFESGKAVFELDQGEHHDHLVCLQCGRVEEFFDAEIEKRQQKIAKDRGFLLQDHSLALYANCIRSDCANRRS
jgi:Fur family transcriptional regulator, ferric uptake regulator